MFFCGVSLEWNYCFQRVSVFVGCLFLNPFVEIFFGLRPSAFPGWQFLLLQAWDNVRQKENSGNSPHCPSLGLKVLVGLFLQSFLRFVTYEMFGDLNCIWSEE